MSRYLKPGLILTLLISLSVISCDDFPAALGEVEGEWNWVSSTGGLLPPRTTENTNYRRVVVIEDGIYRDYRMDTLRSEWEFNLKQNTDGIVLENPGNQNLHLLVNFISADSITIEPYIANGICNDCGMSTFVRGTGAAKKVNQ